ncbi:MAG: BREX-1 system adenine-specific DNA-methyltransferase PglX, partial [Leptospiraceae bacterium]|nr:BREX-1 system adenine-specific DNA-methyltransferase PglX [Leptospiraceae bacterium]
MADKQKILEAIQNFSTLNLKEATCKLFQTLDYPITIYNILQETTKEYFEKVFILQAQKFNKTKALFEDWTYIDLCTQFSHQENSPPLFQEFQKISNDANVQIQSYFLFAVHLKGNDYTATSLAQATREINSLFSIPSLILFKYGNKISLCIIHRRVHKRDEEKDVLEKVSLIKDINLQNPHRAHIEILYDLSLNVLDKEKTFKNFVDLHFAWLKTLSTKTLNEKFYKEIYNWYLWAKQKASFPNLKIQSQTQTEYYTQDQEKENYLSESLIRLLTRLIFIWFIKEKGLVNEELFHKQKLSQILVDFSENSPTYYRAILQNLFFATLNNEMDTDTQKNRYFAEEKADKKERQKEFLVKNLYRYKNYFKEEKEEKILKLFSQTPFLNGGLFDCLDREVEENRKRYYVYLDGFSREEERAAHLPNFLFFGEEQSISIQEGKQTKKIQVRGLISILESYKFTIEETTPIQEEIALDPELLGKVFENLLASYNPETEETARNQTGSFYTPREIVDFMVEESLLEYLYQTLGANNSHLREKLKRLLSYEEEKIDFLDSERKAIVLALANSKILDPACGSGAFPMGVLHKIVHVLQKVDPENELWKQVQKEKIIGKEIQKLEQDKKAIEGLTNEQVKQKALQAVQEQLKELEEIFNKTYMHDDYSRKLYLISNCIYGVDIQPIAIQITKLRFFISLVVDQKVDRQKPNFGIRSLPNLEIKFLAANTLLKLQKPEGFNFKPKGLEELETQLKEVREKYFLAKTRKEKLDVMRKDLEIRKKISTLLKKANYPTSTIAQVSEWNPYDVTAVAPWFDPEYMFEITDGFDIVLGNPPYVSTKGVDEEAKKLLGNTYGFSDDTYNHFYFRGMEVLKKKGILSYISSKTFWTIQTKKNLRELLL